MSQLDLALEAEISTKHLSFLETGRSQPSRDMVLKPRRAVGCAAARPQRSAAGGRDTAPIFRERPAGRPGVASRTQGNGFWYWRATSPIRQSRIDRHWTLVASKPGGAAAARGSRSLALLRPPVNVFAPEPASGRARAAHRQSCGMARAICSTGCGGRLRSAPIRFLLQLLGELRGYPAPPADGSESDGEHPAVVVPFRLITEAGVLSFFSTTTVFGNAGRHHVIGACAGKLLPGRCGDRRNPAPPRPAPGSKGPQWHRPAI